MNDRIRAREVRVIDPEGKQLGILPIARAREEADSLDLDLIEVAPDAKPPVCRIMDYGKFRYEQSRKQKESHKKTKATEVKAIRIRPNTGTHDVGVKVKRAQRFLEQGHKVKFDMIFRGPELRHTEIGRNLMESIAQQCAETAEVERRPRMEGRRMLMVLAPLK